MRKDHRRTLLFGVAAYLAAPLASFTQPSLRMRRIGFLSPDASVSPAGQQARQMFPAALRRLGYEEGSNLVIEWRWSESKVDLPALAEELARLKVELIVARTNDPIAAAKRATRTMPIVMLNGSYPVEMEFVESLARPGGNITGTSYSSPELIEKQIEILREVAPNAVLVAIPWDSGRPRVAGIGKIRADSLERAAVRLGMKLQYFDVSQPDEIDAALDRIAASHVDALWYSGEPILRSRRADIAALALK